jgi:hypothetical protein
VCAHCASWAAVPDTTSLLWLHLLYPGVQGRGELSVRCWTGAMDPGKLSGDWCSFRRVATRSPCAPRPWRTPPSRWDPRGRTWPRAAWPVGVSAAAGVRPRTGEQGGREAGRPQHSQTSQPPSLLPCLSPGGSLCLRGSQSHLLCSTPAVAFPQASSTLCPPARASPDHPLTACLPAPPRPAAALPPTPPQVGGLSAWLYETLPVDMNVYARL